jgi:cell division septal protein FtsQ
VREGTAVVGDPEEFEALWRDYHRREQEVARRYAIQIPIFVVLVGLFVWLLQLV